MPLFFLLSGFSLTIGYGSKIFETWTFYKKRLIRILPVYYFCIILGAILIPLGHFEVSPDDFQQTIGGSLASLFLVQSWILVLGFGPNKPSWTVSTLWFFYLVFPTLLKYLLKRSNKVLSYLLAGAFYLQLTIGFLLMFLIPKQFGLLYYWFSTAHPLSRIPVFFMGVCAGILSLRIKDGDLDALKSKFLLLEIFHLFGLFCLL